MTSTTHCRTGFSSQSSAEITLPSGTSNRDDHFALVFRATGDLDSSDHVRARGNSDEQTFFLSEPTRHGERVVVAHLHALDDLRIPRAVFEVKILRDETRTRALNLVRTGLHWLTSERLRNNGRIFRLDRDGLEGSLLRLDDFAATSDRSTSANRCDQNINLAVRVIPEFHR